MRHACLYGFFIFFLSSCSVKQKADVLYFNGKIYTVDSAFTIAEAFAVKDGKFLGTGTYEELKEGYSATEEINLDGKAVYPGFIDAHCHFYSYGRGLTEANLTGCTSFKEMVERVIKHQRENPSPWIVGRGWDQNLWPGQQFPVKDTFDILFPDKPVFLKRIDGHAALANQAALDIAQIRAGKQLTGGLVETKNGKLTGILVDNAIELVSDQIPEAGIAEKTNALMKAQKNCLEVGLTTVSDAGLKKNMVFLIDSLQKAGQLDMRMYIMLDPSDETKAWFYEKGPYKTDRLNVRSFKIYADGALGSRGACLIEPYADKPGHKGFLLDDSSYFRKAASELLEHGFQMNTHCIGDSANRYILNLYGNMLKGKNNMRWRIEHAQVIHPEDIGLFSRYSVIPSVQPTHATSDMYWAEQRLGSERVKSAYAYKDLLQAAGLVAAGSDFPVEHINPLYGFYAAVSRRDHKGWPEQGFNIENALTREEGLKAMTVWAAYANFEEQEKGSIEKDKWADFVILEEDIMEIPVQQVKDVKVLSTFIAGKKVY